MATGRSASFGAVRAIRVAYLANGEPVGAANFPGKLMVIDMAYAQPANLLRVTCYVY